MINLIVMKKPFKLLINFRNQCLSLEMKYIYIFIFILITGCTKEDNSSLIESYQTQISQYQSQVTQLQTTINSLNSQVSSIPGLENSINSLNTQITQYSNQVTQLQNTINTLTAENSLLESSTIPDLESTIANLNSQINNYISEIERLESIIESGYLTPFNYDFNDSNLGLFYYSGGSTDIVDTPFGKGVRFLHSGGPANNFYSKEFQPSYGIYEFDAVADNFISDIIVRIFDGEGEELGNSGIFIGIRPNNTDNPGIDINDENGKFWETNEISVTQDEWFNVKIIFDLTKRIKLFINDIEIYSSETSLTVSNNNGYFKFGVSYSGIFDNMKYTPKL